MNTKDYYSFKAKNYEYHSGNPYKRQQQEDPAQGGQGHGPQYERGQNPYPEERREGQNQNRDCDYDREDDWYHERHQTPPQEDPFPPPRDYNRQYQRVNEAENNQFNLRQQAQSETSRPRLEPLKLQDPFKLPQQDWEQSDERYDKRDYIRENRAPTGIASSKLSSFLPYGYGFGGRGPKSPKDEDEGKTPPPRRERENFQSSEILPPAVIERAAELVAKKLVDQNQHFKKYPDEPIASSSNFAQGKFMDFDNVASSSASSNQALVSTPTEIITGNVSQFQPDSFGMVGTEIFFMASAVVGRLPQTGDKVVVEAERVSGMPFKFSAKRVQVVSKDLSENSDREREVKRPPPRQQPPPPTKLDWNLKLDPLPQERELNFGPLPEMPKSLNLLTRDRSPPTSSRFKQGPVVSENLNINWELPVQSRPQQQVSFNAHSLEPLPVWEVKQASLPVWSSQNQQNQPVNFPPPIIIHETPTNETVNKERSKPKTRSRSRSNSRRRHSRSRSRGRIRSRSRSNSKLRRRRTRSRSDSRVRRHRSRSRSDSKIRRHRSRSDSRVRRHRSRSDSKVRIYKTRSKSPRSRKSKRSRSQSPINRKNQRGRSQDRIREEDDEIQIVKDSNPGSNRQSTTIERKPKRVPRSIQAQIRHHILDSKKPIEERFVPNPMAKKLPPQEAFEKQLQNNMWKSVPQKIEENKSSKKKKIQEVQEPAYKVISKNKKNPQKAPIEQILIEPIPLNPQEAETQQRITQIKILLGEQQLSKIEDEEKRLLMQQRILHAELFRNKQVQGQIQPPAFYGGPQVVVPAQQIWPVSSGRNRRRERGLESEDGREVERAQRGKEGPVRRVDVDEHLDDVRRESRSGRRSDEKVKRSPKKSELPISWELPSKAKNAEKSNVNWELPSQWKNRQIHVDNSKHQINQHEQQLNLREQEIFQRMTDIRQQQQTKPKVDWDRFAFTR